MERKDSEGKPPRFCHKLFRFLINNLAFYAPRQVTIGRNHPAESKPSIRDEHAAKDVAGKGDKSQFDHSFDEEGEVPLVPPVITIPVEYQEAMEKASAPMSDVVDKREDKMKRKSVRINSGTQEKSVPRDDKGQDMLKRRPSIGEKEKDDKDGDKFKDKELKKKVSLGRPPSLQEQKESEVSGVRPVKPVVRSVSNIDKKVDAFIRERKESFNTS